MAVIAGRGRHGAATTALLTDSLNFLRRSVHHEKRRSSAAVQNVAATLHAICCFAFWSAPVLRRFWSSAGPSAVLSGEHGQADALRTAHATAFGRKRPIGTGNLFRLQSATENLKSKISHAGVVQWQNGSFPSCTRGFDSLHPLFFIGRWTLGVERCIRIGQKTSNAQRSTLNAECRRHPYALHDRNLLNLQSIPFTRSSRTVTKPEPI